MKKNIFLILFSFLAFSSSQTYTEKYDVENFYSSYIPESETLVKTASGEIEEAEEIYVKTEIEEGKYSISVTREDDDFYKIDGTDVYIKTRYCYEYSYSQNAFLIVNSKYGYTKGEIIFFD